MFESIKSSTKGCQYREHKIDFTVEANSCGEFRFLSSADVYSELLNVVDIVCLPKPLPDPPSYYNLYSMTKTELSRVNIRTGSLGREEKRERKRPQSQRLLLTKKQSFASKYKRKPDPAEEDSDIDGQEIVRVVIHQKEPSSIYKNIKKTWNIELPLRLNQDMQRESDLRRMNELLRELRLNKNMCETTDQTDSVGGGGGIFHLLETKMKNTLLNSQISLSGTTATFTRRAAKYSDK